MGHRTYRYARQDISEFEDFVGIVANTGRQYLRAFGVLQGGLAYVIYVCTVGGCTYVPTRWALIYGANLRIGLGVYNYPLVLVHGSTSNLCSVRRILTRRYVRNINVLVHILTSYL